MRGPSTPIIVFLSDDRVRTAALARSFHRVAARFVIDLYEGAEARPDRALVRAVVSDVSFLHPERIDWLRRRLGESRICGHPYFCILQKDTPRKRLQANALGAFRAFPPGTSSELERALVALLANDRRSLALGEAEAAFGAMMEAGRSGEAVTPALVSDCSGFIRSALRDLGVRDMLDMISRFDDATHRHCLLVAGLAAAFSVELGFCDADVKRLTGAALLHDVGKSRIPLDILNKPDRLTASERAVMATHPVLGFDMLQGAGHGDEILEVVRSHHEALDGSGYPDGLSGEKISDLVRLVTICDIFAALIERRPYKAPLSEIAAYELLSTMTGKLDPDLVRAFRGVAFEAAKGARIVA